MFNKSYLFILLCSSSFLIHAGDSMVANPNAVPELVQLCRPVVALALHTKIYNFDEHIKDLPLHVKNPIKGAMTRLKEDQVHLNDLILKRKQNIDVTTLETGGKVLSIDWHKDGQLLAAGLNDGTIEIWNTKTGARVQTLKGHTEKVVTIAWHKDGILLASGSNGDAIGSKDGSIKIFNTLTGKCVQTMPNEQANTIAWHKDGQRLASGSEVGSIKIWNAKTGACIKKLSRAQDYSWHAQNYSVNKLAWHKDGILLASGSEFGAIKIWNTLTRKCVQTMSKGPVNTIAWHKDGILLASDGYDYVGNYLIGRVGTIDIWNTQTGQYIRALKGHSSGVHTIAWYKNGQWLASGSWGGLIKIWDIEMGKCLKTLTGHTDSAEKLEWHKDGQLLASGSLDKTIKIWHVSFMQLIPTLNFDQLKLLLQALVSWKKDESYILRNADEYAVYETLPQEFHDVGLFNDKLIFKRGVKRKRS